MTQDIDNNVKESFDESKSQDSVWLKSLRLAINLLINILIVLTVFVCFLFVCDHGISFYTLHIILSVLGYQFFMCQGTLTMSKYNAWSVFISRRHRKHIHIALQFIGVIFAIIGTSFIIHLKKPPHFTTVHGKLGLAALICSILSLVNGSLAMYPTKLFPCINSFWTRCFHYVTGLASTFLGTGCLCAGFKYRSFKSWVAHDNAVPVLIAFTWLFTVLVSIDFWIVMVKKIRNMFRN